MKKSRSFRSKSTAILWGVVGCDQVSVDKSIARILAASLTAMHFCRLAQLGDITSGLAELRCVYGCAVGAIARVTRTVVLVGKKLTWKFVCNWRHMFDYFFAVKGLFNLRWVFSPNHGDNAGDYYPGDGYVDVRGLETHGDRTDRKRFHDYERVARASTPCGFTECGLRGSAALPGDSYCGRLSPPFAAIFPARIFSFTGTLIEVRCATGAVGTKIRHRLILDREDLTRPDRWRRHFMKTTHRSILRSCLFFGLLPVAGLLAEETATLQPLAEPRLWTPVEFRLDHAPVAASNFDPDQIAINAVITTPSGTQMIVPAFWFQDFARSYTDTGEKLTPTGEPGWRLRYTPTEEGTYHVEIVAIRPGESRAALTKSTFTVSGPLPAGQHGWVRVGVDRRYFQTSDGRPLRLIGANMCWPEKDGTLDYEIWFKKLHDAGGNCARLWMAPWWAAIEQDPDSLTRYRQDASWQLDRVFAAAEREGIYLILSMDFHGIFQSDNPAWGGSGNYWPKNPYNIVNGGPCRNPNDFFTDAMARAIYTKRLRYLIARYGASPRLLAWQFFNEIDNVFEPRGLRESDVAAWHADMGRWLKAHDPYGHLISTSLTGGSDREMIWKIPEMDFAVYHSYGESAPARSIAKLAEDFRRRYAKPVVIGEYGVDSRGWAHDSDPHLRGLRQALWGGTLGGAAGTPLPWWWVEMDRDNVYPIYAALSAVLRRGEWNAGDWRPADATVVAPSPSPVSGPAEYSGVVNLNLLGRAKVPGIVRLTSRLTAERAFEAVSGHLRGQGIPGFDPQALEISALWGNDAELAVHIRGVLGAPEIIARVDDREVARQTIDNPQSGLPYRLSVDQTMTIAVPKGEHRVRLEISGTGAAALDRCSVGNLIVSADAPVCFDPEVVALRQDDRAIVYLVSPWMVYPAGALAESGVVQHGQRVVLSDWPDGTFKAEWLDPATARSIGTAVGLVSDGALQFPLPDYTEDLVVVITRE